MDCGAVLGSRVIQAVRRARDFLVAHSTEDLLEMVGQIRPELALAGAADKRSLPASYGGGQPSADDLLSGFGPFYVTEAGKVMLDCTSGHYQMTWGYGHPELTCAVRDASEVGIVWDNHSNIPGQPVKALANELAGLGAGMGLDRVLLGICTGSVACSSALKIMLARHSADAERQALGPPVMVALAGNYHGTDMVAQTIRGMWPDLLVGMETALVEPDDAEALRAAFAQHGRRVAGFWAEPVMMNREAIRVEPDFLRLAQQLCAECGACMAIDEIQTGFWYPEVLLSKRWGLRPDLLIVGKGMTAGFHPLSALLYRSELDILEQYDAISTNGGASLASLVALCNLQMIRDDRKRLAGLAARHYDGLEALVVEFPALIQEANGEGLLSGLKFRRRHAALGFHRAAVERGLWLRAHAYHPGHRTVLMKHCLAVDKQVVDWVISALRHLLETTPWRN